MSVGVYEREILMMKFGLIFIYGFSIIKRKQHTRKKEQKLKWHA